VAARLRRWAMPLRITASIVMLAVLFERVHLASLLPEWSPARAAWLVAALVVTGAGIVLSAVRWRAVLAALGLRARVATLLHHYLAGLFVGNFLPSTIGGDVLRVRRLSAENGAGADTFASVVLERLTGWIVLPVITLTALATATAVTTLVLLGVLLLVVAHPSVGGRFADGEGWQRFAGAVHLGLTRFRRNPLSVLGVLVTGFAYQLVVVLAAFLAARALGIDPVGITATLVFVPAVAIVQVLPISLAGLGVREGAFVVFLHPLGVQRGQAIALGLLVYGLNLAVSLLGAPSFAAGGSNRSNEPVAA